MQVSSELYMSVVAQVSPENTHIHRVTKFISNSLTETLKLKSLFGELVTLMLTLKLSTIPVNTR